MLEAVEERAGETFARGEQMVRDVVVRVEQDRDERERAERTEDQPHAFAGALRVRVPS